jgi:arylamine N-acetyltransferase
MPIAVLLNSLITTNNSQPTLNAFAQSGYQNMYMDAGRITLSDDSLTINQGGTKRKNAVTSQEIKEILRKYFGISGTPI